VNDETMLKRWQETEQKIEEAYRELGLVPGQALTDEQFEAVLARSLAKQAWPTRKDTDDDQSRLLPC